MMKSDIVYVLSYVSKIDNQVYCTANVFHTWEGAKAALKEDKDDALEQYKNWDIKSESEDHFIISSWDNSQCISIEIQETKIQ